jgi:hypothetical protein
MLIVPQLISGLAAYATRRHEKKYTLELSIIGGLTFLSHAAKNINNGHHNSRPILALLIAPTIKTLVLMGIGNLTGRLTYDCLN